MRIVVHRKTCRRYKSECLSSRPKALAGGDVEEHAAHWRMTNTTVKIDVSNRLKPSHATRGGADSRNFLSSYHDELAQCLTRKHELRTYSLEQKPDKRFQCASHRNRCTLEIIVTLESSMLTDGSTLCLEAQSARNVWTIEVQPMTPARPMEIKIVQQPIVGYTKAFLRQDIDSKKPYTHIKIWQHATY